MGILRTLLVLLVLLVVSPCWSATYYVKNGGNDGLAGTSDETAWETIAKVVATATSGDTVYFRSQDTWEATSGSRVLAATAGVTYDGSTYGAGTRAKFKAVGPHVNGAYGIVSICASNVIFKGFEIDGSSYWNSGILIGPYHATGNISDITVDNCVVHHIRDPLDPDSGHYGYAINVSSTVEGGITISNVTITNTTIYNSVGEAIALYQSWGYPGNKTNGVLIRGCTVYNSGPGLLVANDTDNVTVEFNHFYENVYGVYIRTSPLTDGQNGAPNNIIFRYNYVHDSKQWGIEIVNPQSLPMSMDIYGNIIADSGTDNSYPGAAELNIAQYDWTGCVFNIYNNTFYSTKNVATQPFVVIFGLYGTTWSGSPTVNFKNNIVYVGTSTNSLQIPIYENGNANGGITYANNLVYRAAGSAYTHVHSNSTDYNRAAVTTWDATAQNTDPTFTGGTLLTGFSGTYGTDMVPNAAYFKISTGNALNNGATLGSPYNGCINGAGLSSPVIRPWGAAYDIGAYEYYSGGTITPGSGGSATFSSGGTITLGN